MGTNGTEGTKGTGLISCGRLIIISIIIFLHKYRNILLYFTPRRIFFLKFRLLNKEEKNIAILQDGGAVSLAEFTKRVDLSRRLTVWRKKPGSSSPDVNEKWRNDNDKSYLQGKEVWHFQMP